MFEEDESLTLNQFEVNNQHQQDENNYLNNNNNQISGPGSTSNPSEINLNETTNNINSKRAINTILELSEDELNRIEDYLKLKIIKNSENFLNQYDNLRATSEKLKIEYEQQFLELEAEYNECQTKLESESRNSHLNQIKANEFDEKLSTYIKHNRILNDDKETLISNVQRLNTVNQNLESEKRDIHIRLDKYIRDNDRLNEEWKSMNSKLSEIESKFSVATAKLEESQSREATITFREKQFQSDKQRLLNEIEWLNSELEKKSSQMLQTRSDFNQKTFEYETKLEDLTAENKKLKSLNETLQSANKAMEEQVDDLSNKLQELREKYAQSKNDFQEESQSRERIIQLYQEENSSSKQKLDEAAEAITDLKQMVLEVKNEYSKLLDEKQTTETAFESKLKENNEMIARLEQELKNANELLSIAKRKGATVLSEADIEQLSPAAAVASRLLKNGMTLTQIYSEYVNLAESLQNEKNETQRLKTYISEVVKEIEEKAPVLKRQKMEYEEGVKTIDNLTNQLENAMMDYEVLKSKSEDSIKKYNLVSSENIRLKQDCNDLSRQVTVLLHEVEKLRSKLLSASRKSANNLSLDQSMNEINESITEVSSSSEVISKDILLFRNIEELQKQNQKLVRLLHEVTDKKQSEEKNELEQKTKEYNERLSLALRELEEVKIQREKHEQVVDEIRRQRDTYKQLLNSQQHQLQRNINQQDMTVSSFLTSTPGQSKIAMSTKQIDSIDSKLNEETTKELNEKTFLLDKLQKQFETYQSEMIKTNKILNEEIETYRKSNSELNMKLALSDSRLESTLEKCKSLNTAIEKCRKELDANKERNSKLSELIIKHEQSISSTTQELNRSSEKICELETKLHSLTFERDMLKSNHERIVKERDLLMQENASRSTILSNLDMIKNSCERNERETKLIYTQKIDQLERENLIQRKQLEQDKEKHDVIIKSWQSQYDQLQQADEKEKEEHEKTRHLYTNIKIQFDELKLKCNELEAKLHSNELIVQMTRNSKSSSAISRLTHLEEETKDSHMKLSLADKEIVSLKIQLEESKGHAKQYKSIAETMEKTVKESSEANEKTKYILQQNINDLESKLASLNAQFEQISTDKSNLELNLLNQKEQSDNRINSLEMETNQLGSDLDLLKKKLENAEKIIEERSKHRDDYVAKLAILEEQLNDTEFKLTNTDKELILKSSRINELEHMLQARLDEIESEKRSKLDMQQNFENNQCLLNESVASLKKENESLTMQINLLQQELSKLGQDLIVLQKQDSFKSKNRQSLTLESSSTDILLNETIEENQSSSTNSNLLEINRYLRVQKDQLEEKYENVKLTFDINQQRFKSTETELEFYRKQSQSLESELNHLKANIDNYKLTNNSNGESKSTNENFNLLLDTNKRLKEECDSLNLENSKIKNDINNLEEEISNLKANLSEFELRNESIRGENTCMVTELKRWKDRCDALLQSSEHAEEWSRIKNEVQKAQEKAQDLTDMINELRKNLTDSNSKSEQLVRDLESAKSVAASEKQKLQSDLDILRGEKTRREEMFKTLVSELREVVIIVQKELELKNVDWSMKGQGADKLKSIKEEIQQLKQSIIEKLNNYKEEIRNKPKQMDELTNEMSTVNKKLEETENKLKEKDTRIGQMNNFISQMKTKLSTCQKAKDDAVKELNDYKSSPSGQATNVHLHETTPSTSVPATNNDQAIKTELETLKSRFLQSQFENERLKKELASNNSDSKQTSTQQQQQTSQTLLASSATATAPAPSTTSPQQQKASNSSAITSMIENPQVPPPTAYIAPSRINKNQPQQQQQQLQTPSQQQQQQSNRRTAAVQPTLHDSGPVQVQQQRQLVTPINNEPQQNEQQLIEQQSTPLVAPSTSNWMISNQNNNTPSSATFLNKRTREEEQTDDSVQPGTSNANNAVVSNQTKKQRSSETYIEQHSTVATIEPYPPGNNNTGYTDQNEYIVINDDQLVANEINEMQDSQEEIILDDDDDTNNNNNNNNNENANSESQENEFDVIITEVNSGRSINENLQQNVLSSTSENQLREAGSGNVQLEDYVEEEEINEELEDEQDHNEQDDVVEDDDESNQRNNNNEDDDDGGADEDLRLESNDQENVDSNIRANSESNEDNIGQEDDSQNDQYEDNNNNNNNNQGGQNEISPDSSAQQGVQDQQQQNIQSSVISSESNNQNTNVNTQQQSKSNFSISFGQQQQQLTQTKSIIMPSTSTFGSNTTEQRKEPPKPIVWDASTNQQQQQTNPFQTSALNSSTRNFQIRRHPVAQTSNPFQQQAGLALNPNATNAATTASTTTTQTNYFQNEVLQQQQQQQQTNTYRIQNNPFKLQHSAFAANQPNMTNTTTSINQASSLASESQQRANLLRNQQRLQQQQQMQVAGAIASNQIQQQQQLQQQQPQTRMARGGGTLGGPIRRGGANSGAGLNNPGGLNPSQRGGRSNF